MIRRLSCTLFAGLVLALMAGCSKPETPQEVAAAFWQAMADGDAGEVVALSTLRESAGFDGYERNWANTVPAFGRVVIEEGEASIVTRLPAEEAAREGARLELVTYLVKEGEAWKVDYQRTGDAILHPSPFRDVMGELNKLGGRLKQEFSSSSEDVEDRMEQLASRFEAYSIEMRQKARAAITDFGEQLQDAMRELRHSVEEALEEERQSAPEDRVILEQASRGSRQPQ